MKLNDLKWFAAYLALMLVMIPFALLPRRTSDRAGELLGALLYRLLGKWRRTGIETLSSLLPYLQAQPTWNCRETSAEAIIRQVFANIGILVAELSWLYFGKGRKLLEDMEIRGLENFEAAHRRGRGIIGITAHSGNWELMAIAFGLQITPVAVVAREMKKDYFSRVLEKIRTQYGNKIIYRDNGVREMLTFLKANGTFGILPDQVVKPPHGILVPFFGRPAWTTFMPAKLAIKTGSAILPFFMHRENNRNVMTIYPELELLTTGSEEERLYDGTLKMNRAIEEQILRHPTQWNWLYRRWKGTEEFTAAIPQQEEVDSCNPA
jgi:KDO2-lipid IV(A) lauroyltransferase